MEDLAEKTKSPVKKYLVDTTSMVVTAHPVYAAIETFISGMSNDVSIKSRLTATALLYGGLGYVYAKGRELTQRMCNITKESSERVKNIHDMGYGAFMNFTVSTGICLGSGAHVDEAVTTGVAAAILSPVTGPLAGYSIDAGRDLMGIEVCDRPSYPKFIKEQGSGVKKCIAGLVGLISAGSMALMYALNY